MLLAAALLYQSAGAEEAPLGDAARTCLHINDNPIEGDWDERVKIRETWVAACRQAAAAEPPTCRKHRRRCPPDSVQARVPFRFGNGDDGAVA